MSGRVVAETAGFVGEVVGAVGLGRLGPQRGDAAFIGGQGGVADDLEEALGLAADAPRVFVMGGAQLYALALPRADELVLTEVDAEFEADAFFPAWDRSLFDEVAREPRVDDAGRPFAFVTYRRKSS